MSQFKHLTHSIFCVLLWTQISICGICKWLFSVFIYTLRSVPTFWKWGCKWSTWFWCLISMMYGRIQCIVSKGINWKSGSIIGYTLGTWVGEKQNKTSVFRDKKPFRKEGVVDWWCLPVGLNDIGYSPSCHLWQQSITLTLQRGLTENTHQTIRIRKI